MREQVYTFAADIWSAMAVAVEMMTGKDPWNAFNQDALVLIVSRLASRYLNVKHVWVQRVIGSIRYAHLYIL